MQLKVPKQMIAAILGIVFLATQTSAEMKAENTPAMETTLRTISSQLNSTKMLESDTAKQGLEAIHNQLFFPDYVSYTNIAHFKDMDSLKQYLYNIDKEAYVTEQDLDIDRLLAQDLSVDFSGEEPKILIFHTHSQERFADSGEGIEDSIVGVGAELVRILAEDYGITAMHHLGKYDVVDGKTSTAGAYERMEVEIMQTLADNPSIEVCIDLHRDALPDGMKLLWDNNGVPTSPIMYFNGMSRRIHNGEIQELDHLPNPHQEENLALSLQMKLLSNELYPGFTRKNYIRAYRYSLHMLGKSMLVEVGSHANTVEESYNAMQPFAEILVQTLMPTK